MTRLTARRSAQLALAVGLFLVALGGRFALTGWLPPHGFPFLTFFPAVLLSAYVGGLLAGLVASVLSVAAAYRFFMPAEPSAFLGVSTGDAIALVFFSAILVFDCVVLDLLVRSRRLLAERGADLHNLVNNSPDVLTRFDRALRHRFVSAAIEEITGRPPAEFIGRTNRELGMPPELCDRWDAALQSVFDQASPTHLDFAYGGRHFSTRLAPERNASGAIEFVLGVTRDVTDLVRHQQALEAQDAFKDRFIATLAHELRNPLAALRNGIGILRRGPGPGMADRTLTLMERQMTHVARLVGDLLDVSRIRENKLHLDLAPTDVRTAIEVAVDACASQMHADGVHHVELLPAAMPIHGDHGRLVQVFVNLLSNASKFNPRGGIVSLRAEARDGVYEISVADGGPGIAADMLERIFEPFVQGEAGLARGSGLGIGLSLVKTIVALHGGSVRAESGGPQTGTTFIVRLPAG